jgi:hypothetical protein
MPRKVNAPLPQPVFGEPVFAEGGTPTPDPMGFKTPHPSDAQQYKQIQNLLKKDVVSFTASRGKPGDLYALQDALGAHGPEIVSGIESAGQITFHVVGDSGASSSGKYKNELRVSDQVTADAQAAAANSKPAFLFHLGDLVYDFGESKYYYDQFYEPFRSYPAPIFAIPGNHDSFVIPGTAKGETPLDVFMRNFCATKPVVTQEAASLHRTAMTQPGIYFALDAPFVRIIGLFSNALEDPGLISSESGKWPGVPDLQLNFLTAQLQRIKKENYAGAVLLATHHPPFIYAAPPSQGSTGGRHSGSPAMLADIDKICAAQGVYPHAIISGHAHNYQRFTRTVQLGAKPYDAPFIICGDGGHGIEAVVRSKGGQTPTDPANGANVGYLDPNPVVKNAGTPLLIEQFDSTNYGYLRVSVTKQQLVIAFHTVAATSLPQSRVDAVTVDIASHTMVSN